MKLNMTETELVRVCINYLLYKGHFVWRNNTGMTRSSYTDKSGVTKNRVWRSGIRGASDIIGVSKFGRFLAIECKIKPNKPTLAQKEFIREVLDRSGIALVVYDVEDLEKAGL
jgi:hypothetical protein